VAIINIKNIMKRIFHQAIKRRMEYKGEILEVRARASTIRCRVI
jgi:hypothetical protein